MNHEHDDIAGYIIEVVNKDVVEANAPTEPGRLCRSNTLQIPQGSGFVRGPVQLEWLQQAIPLGRKALHVAMAIWYTAGFKRQGTIKLTRKKLEVFQVTTETARTLLHKFEAAGLVSVDRKRGRSPIVTIKPVDVQSSD